MEEEINDILRIEKASDVPKDSQIFLENPPTLFKFSCEVDESKDVLCLILSEINHFSPHIYKEELKLAQIYQINRCFRVCDNLKEAKEDIDLLFKKGHIKIINKEGGDVPKSLDLQITAGVLSKEETFGIETKMKITLKKDESLLFMYEIQKKQIKLLNEIAKTIENMPEKNETTQKILAIIQNGE